MNNKINLIPNRKHSNKYNQSDEQQKKTRKETFSMHMPDEEDELNNTEENNESDFKQDDEIKKEENTETRNQEIQKNKSDNQNNKKTFLDKLKGFFIKK